MSTTTRAYAAQTARSPLAPFEAPRREVGPHDVHIDIAFCGVCMTMEPRGVSIFAQSPSRRPRRAAASG